MDKELNKSEKLGLFLYKTLGILLLIGLFYLVYISGLTELLDETLVEKFGEGIGSFYLAMSLIGMATTTILLFRIVEKLFYPDTEEDIEFKEKRREIMKLKKDKGKKYESEIKILRTEMKLKRLKNE